jgi:PA14 domain
VAADNFSARWTGTITIPTTGNYRFITQSDDGVRLWINGVQVVNNWTDHGVANDITGNIYLTAGQRVPITLEYYERTAGATMRLGWLRPGTTGYYVIPTSNLNIN